MRIHISPQSVVHGEPLSLTAHQLQRGHNAGFSFTERVTFPSVAPYFAAYNFNNEI